MSRNGTRRTARRLIGVAALAGLSLLTTTSARAANASATSIAAQAIKADSAQFPVFGVTLNQTAELDTLTNVVVGFNSAVNFSTGDLAPDVAAAGCGGGDESSCDGVQMFRDDGDVDDVLDSADTPVSTGFTFLGTNCAVGCEADLTLTDELAGVPIPLTSAGEGYTFLIAIRTSSSIGNGDAFTVSLQPTAFTTAPTPTLMTSVVTTDPITADANVPAAPVVTGLGLSRGAGRVHVTTPAVSTEALATLEVYSSTSETCSSPSLVATSGSIDLRQTNEDLLGAAAGAAIKAFPLGRFVCYRISDPAGNTSAFVADGDLPAAPSAAHVALLASSNVTGAKRVAAAPDTSARTLRMYIRPGDAGDFVRARNEDALVHNEWIEVTTSTIGTVCSLNPPSATACTTDILRYNTSTSAGPTLAAGDGVGYTLVNANGNEGDVTADGVVPAAPASGDTDVLRVSAATGKQRLIIAGGTPGAAFGLYMDTTGLGTTFRPAVSPSGALVTVTATGGSADSATTEIHSETPSGTQLSNGHAIGYVAIGSGGNVSAVTAEGTIPAAPVASDLTFSDALDQFRWNPAVLPGNTNVRAFVGTDAAAAYGDGSGLGTATNTTPVSVGDQDAGLGVFYVAINTVSGHESPTTADGLIPAAPSADDIGILSTSAANSHQRTISSPDVDAPRTFRLYVDPAGGTAWVRASTTSGGSTAVEVTSSGGTATSGGTPGAQSIFANTTQLAGAHAVGFALTSGGNDSDVAADGSIPALPIAADGSVSDAANTFSYLTASPSYRANLHLGASTDTAALAYSQAGPDGTANSSSPAAISDPANDATVFYTATEPVSGNESRTTADGAIPAVPTTGDAGILSVSAAQAHQRLRADLDASGPRAFRLFVDPDGATAWQPAVTTADGSASVEVTTSTSAPVSSSTTAIFAGPDALDVGWAIGYGMTNANGHASDVVADSTIPAAPDLSTASATAAIDQVTMTGIATNRTVRVFTDAAASQSAAYAAGAKATLTAADGEEPLDTDGGWGVYYTSSANFAGHESPIATDGPIPQPIAASTTEASDAFNRFTVPGASATDNVLIILSSASSPFDAYQDGGATRYTAVASPFEPGAELDPLFVFYTVKNTTSGNESPITSAGSIPAAPSGADTTMSASAALQRISSTLDTSARTLRLHVDVDGGGASPFVRAATTSDGSTPVQITTSTSAEVVGGAGIFAGATVLAAGHDVAYSRVLGQNESDLVTDGAIPVAPLADAFTASAADQQATIGSAAISGTYRVFRGSAPASDKRTHTSGTPTLVPTSGLVAGDAIGYALTNAAGNESPLFADGSIPSVSTPVLQAASDSGVSDSDRITNIATPVFDVTAVAGASVTLLEGGTTRGGPIVADGGGLAAVPSSALAEGAHTLTALATKDGNTSPLSGGVSVTIDVTGPVAPDAPDLDAASDTGDSATDDLTSVTTPLVNVAGAPNGSISIKEGATVVGSATTDGSGAGQATTSSLSEGAHTLVATTFDTAGNESVDSAGLTITIDVTAPTVPGAPDLQAASDSNVTDDDVTNITTPVFDVAGNDANVTVSLRDFGAEVASAASGVGGPVEVASSALSDGAHSLTAVALDAAGNASAASGALVVTVDTVAPVVPGVPDLLAASDSGSSAVDDLTSDATPSLASAGSEVGATVALVEGATPLGSATADGTGNVTITSSSLSDGVHALTATATDVAGNGSAASSALDVTVDTVAPAVLAAAPDLLA
ncbi:MAG TPA: Ig-like domain-containing protein, partial [Actinomycetota bacterium]